MPKPERTFDDLLEAYADVAKGIAELEIERREIKRLLVEAAPQRLGRPPVTGSSSSRERILRAMVVGTIMTRAQVIEAAQVNRDNVHKRLSELLKAGLIERVAEGQYKRLK